MMIEFSKYQGLGNDFILIDNRHLAEPIITPNQAIAMCDRHFGIGGDGVIFALPGTEDTDQRSQQAPSSYGGVICDYTMRIFNSDGSEPEMCGNGIRCFAKFIADLEGNSEINKSYKIQTLAGLIVPQLESNGEVTVDMGEPELLAAKIPTTLKGVEGKVIAQPLEAADRSWLVTTVSMGNPHCITFVDDCDSIPLEKIGLLFEHHPAFPQRTNTEFIEVVKPDYIKMRVWERGAGITLACGTGACASVVAGVLNQKCDRQCTVELPGGCLQIHWSAVDNHVYMTGPATEVFKGQYC